MISSFFFGDYSISNNKIPLDISVRVYYNKKTIDNNAAVVELADAKDLKSFDGDIVPVRVRSAAPKNGSNSKNTLPFFL